MNCFLCASIDPFSFIVKCVYASSAFAFCGFESDLRDRRFGSLSSDSQLLWCLDDVHRAGSFVDDTAVMG